MLSYLFLRMFNSKRASLDLDMKSIQKAMKIFRNSETVIGHNANIINDSHKKTTKPIMLSNVIIIVRSRML